MPAETLDCPGCGRPVKAYRNPFPTVDVIIELPELGDPPPVVFIKRNNPPLGWALPGGFVDYGETLEQAAVREAREETGLAVKLAALLGAYSDPARDSRQHNISLVYVARAAGTPVAGSDAGAAMWVLPEQAPSPLCFDHATIIKHYLAWRRGEQSAAPVID